MSVKGAPVITPCKSTDNYTRVTFKPDLQKFGMETFEEARLSESWLLLSLRLN